MTATINSNPSVPFNQAYWVVPDRFMAGCYPGAEHFAGTRNLSSPETDQQIELVCSWRQGE